MPGKSERDSGDEDTGRDEAADRQEENAADLAKRAAESVDRRYDVTKEVHLGDTD